MIKKTLKNIAKIVLAGALTFIPVTGCYNGTKEKTIADPIPVSVSKKYNPSVNLILTGVARDDGYFLNRNEAFVNKIPLNSDVYSVWESCNETDFYKIRLQSMPVKWKNLSFGLAFQYVNGSNFNERTELGIATNIQGKPSQTTFAKGTFRYFPDRETIDTYCLFDSSRVYADLLGSYNTETGNAMLMPGIDWKLNKQFTLGLEAKFSGKFDNLKKNYFGPRLKVKF